MIHNFRREDQLDQRRARAAGALDHPLLGSRAGAGSAGAGGDEPFFAVPMGGAWLLDHLRRLLGVAEAIGRVAKRRRVTGAVERLTFCLVANRALDPMSKLAALEWAQNDTWLPGSASWAPIRRSSTARWTSCWTATRRSSARCSSPSLTFWLPSGRPQLLLRHQHRRIKMPPSARTELRRVQRATTGDRTCPRSSSGSRSPRRDAGALLHLSWQHLDQDIIAEKSRTAFASGAFAGWSGCATRLDSRLRG